jgi:hypothetical protein
VRIVFFHERDEDGMPTGAVEMITDHENGGKVESLWLYPQDNKLQFDEASSERIRAWAAA